VALNRFHRRRAVFLDKDGTLVEDVPYNVDPDRICLTARAGAGLGMLHRAGFRLVVVTNQSGVARGMFAEEALGHVEHHLRRLLAREGVPLAGFYSCPHLAAGCSCRKPQPGLLRRAAMRSRTPSTRRGWCPAGCCPTTSPAGGATRASAPRATIVACAWWTPARRTRPPANCFCE
jgi:D-glycero-D-manno-heptose 1,7-bisphosphate phosphatase